MHSNSPLTLPSRTVPPCIIPPRIVLVEPAGPLNVGSVARVMKNFGLSQLILVNPQCDRFCDDSLKMAVHARDILDQARVVDTLAEALAGVQRAIATTGLSPRDKTPLETPRQVLPWLVSVPAGESEPVEIGAILFGREERGLTNDELHYAQRRLQIPSDPAYSSLNLAQAVAVCCYEWSQIAQGFSGPTPSWKTGAIVSPATDPIVQNTDDASRPIAFQSSGCSDASEPGFSASKPGSSASELGRLDPPASLQDLQGYYGHLESVLLKIGYLYPHTAASRMKRFRRLYNRAQPSSPEIHQLRGILSQVEWLLSRVPSASEVAKNRDPLP